MDFYQIKDRPVKNGVIEIYPDFSVKRSRDLMVRAKSFYAVWDEEKGCWSSDEYEVQRLIDAELREYKENLALTTDAKIVTKLMGVFSSASWQQYRSYLGLLTDNYHVLDSVLTWQNSKIKKTDYVSRSLPYSLEAGSFEAYDELMSELYEPEEREKLEWAIGAIVAGEAKDIQKFIVLYGEGGSGKSTLLNIIQQLFVGYYSMFEAKELTSGRNAFSTEAFRNNPLVAIQHDGDLSGIEDNTKLNSIVSHEEIIVNEKHKPTYTLKMNAFLFMATNKPVRITDAKSGLIRRLIDVTPSGRRIPSARYISLMSRIGFELGAIAYHCLEVYQALGKNHYAAYKPLNMILRTDVFFNFVEVYYYQFGEEDGVSLAQAYALYKTFCGEALIEHPLPRHRFRDELRNYFENFDVVTRVDGVQVRSYFSGFKKERFKQEPKKVEVAPSWLTLDQTVSLLDDIAKECSAQYANEYELPKQVWSKAKTTLAEIDTTKLHYVKLPHEHVVIDFDLRDDSGNKSLDLNLEAASKFPPTYGELSKSKAGVHLHYIWKGEVDPSDLERLHAPGIEVKVFNGDAAIRRVLSMCNHISVATLSSGLAVKEKKVADIGELRSEKGLRDLIMRNLRKEIHPATKPSIDFIMKILEEAKASGMKFDVRDLRTKIFAFAASSSNQSEYCMKAVMKMTFNSDESELDSGQLKKNKPLVFYDVEVFPNLFLVCWKYQGTDSGTAMINPSPAEVEALFDFDLVGFNNRRYDNHMLYARFLGYSVEEIYRLSKKLIDGTDKVLFGEAYNLSYADVYDFSSVKQSLKKWEIDLGIRHLELGFPFDQEVPQEKIPLVVEYCMNDVDATERVFENRKQDYVARLILSDLSGLSVNQSTQSHTAKIIFGNDQRPQDKFIYTDLSQEFPGYSFDSGKSMYRGEETGEGGYVYAEPGYYEDVLVLDVASMHPTSIFEMNMFGPYTPRYKELLEARLAIKHKDYAAAKKMLGGMLNKYLDDPKDAADLAYALKIHALNIVYGLTSAKFENRFRDPRNRDNIVAKRGALFMIDLKHAVQDKGFTVCHIKTDSIKIPKPTPEIVDFVMAFGKKYGYAFEIESRYKKFLLVNDAVYIAVDDEGQWNATGAEFAHPYIFKTLFSKEVVAFSDLCETKTVTTAMYLDKNEGVSEGEHNYIFVGKAGSFCPVKPGTNGGILLREKDGKYSAVTGTKGYRWQESETLRILEREDDVDYTYYEKLVNEAREHIEKFTDFDKFVS